MARLVAVVVALCACHKAPPRIYTDRELAALEQRVLAEVAKGSACSHPELLDIETAVDEPCNTAMSTMRSDVDAESNAVAKLDEQCSAKVLEVFGRAAATSPGCSPYQVGVRGEPPTATHGAFGGFVEVLHAARMLGWHALRETDHYVGLMELFMALGVAQDFGRGRINLLEAMKADAMMNNLASNAQKLLTQSSLTREQLVDAATMLDAIQNREPSFSETLQGETLSMAIHQGVAALKPLAWQPPGGRTDWTSWKGAYDTSGHDGRDDAGELMALGLRRLDRFREACPPTASLVTCHRNLASHDSPVDPDRDRDLTDKQAARVAMFPDDKTRHESQEQLIAALAEPEFLEDYVGKHAWTFSRLIALRLQLQVLIDGHCPSETQLAAPPWSTLRAPALLGDSVRVTRSGNTLLIDAPAWAMTTTLQRKSPPPFPIPCP